MPDHFEGGDVAAMVSGGVDSAVLAVDLLRRFDRVYPIYVRCGLRWEGIELDHLRTYLLAVERPGLMPLQVLDEPIADIYGEHWSTNRPDVPSADSPDEAVYLPGRNLLLVAKAAIWCRLHEVPDLALGCLASNPFPDSTPAFYEGFEGVLEKALASRFRLLRPFEGLHKADVLHRGAGLPLHLTFSCLKPVNGQHCGRCNKCAERRRGFDQVGRQDLTVYASDPAHAPGSGHGGRPRVPCTE
jgi:7-cyano-7-deazaguanine synthase